MNLRINTGRLIDIFSFIFVFVVMVDPPNTLLGLKNIAFGLLFLACLLAYKMTWKPVWAIIVIVYVVISVSIVIGYLQGFTFDIQMVKSIYKTYVLLFLLLWINKLSLWEKLFFPAWVIACTVIIIYCLIAYHSVVGPAIYNFFTTKHELIMIGERTFVGMKFLSIYYKSIALLIIPLAFYVYELLFKDKNKLKNGGLSILLLMALLFSGTRACMLSSLLLIFVMTVIRIYQSRMGKWVAVVVTVLAVMGSCVMLYKLLNDKNEMSLQIKAGHLHSYKKLVTEHPLVLVFGEGAGSKFYSEGFKKETTLTEWSYAELVRWFGLFGAGIIVFIYFFPLYIFYRKRKILPYSLPARIGYSFYLFIAGTNPLLLGSTGLITLLIMYSYAFNPKYEQV